jgi:LPXTG-site transpeptidase (sortase) family protein
MAFNKHLSRVLLGLSVTSVLIGAVIAFSQYRQNVRAVKVSKAAAVTAPSTNKPSVSTFDNYSVASDLPRYIIIPAINVKAIAKPEGVTKSGKIGAPDNVYDAGWFNQSSKPGQSGAMVVDGHVSSWSTKGIFYNLKLLKTGDSVQIEKGNDTMVSYVVVKTQTYDATNVDMNSVLKPVTPNKPGINLITCAGSVSTGTNEFDKRIVVFAEME